MTEPRYLQKIVDGAKDLPVGTVTDVQVLHDDWCKLLRGKGECDCDPEVRFKPSGDTLPSS